MGNGEWEEKYKSKTGLAQCKSLVDKMVQLCSYGSFIEDLLLCRKQVSTTVYVFQ